MTRRRFRATPALALRRLDELPPEQQAALRELQEDAGFYGVLVPLDAAATLKSVDRDTAELFLTLASPASLDCAGDDVLDLVLDGILEVEHDGAFVSGADAYPLFFPIPATHADTLSTEALRHAEELATNDLGLLTTALYTYNRLPRTRAWVARFPDRDSVLAYLGRSPLLARHWSLAPAEAAGGWISWAALEGTRARADGVTWKLYVSPRPEHVRDAFHALVRVLAEIPGAQMKIGGDAAGLLRPDKLVAYFASKRDLDAAAHALANELRGCPAHGVPFTASIDDAGLLAWGVDPPDSERALSWMERESWRLWIAKSLAGAMAIGKGGLKPALRPWQFALERVRRRGVDVDTWTPHESLWRATA